MGNDNEKYARILGPPTFVYNLGNIFPIDSVLFVETSDVIKAIESLENTNKIEIEEESFENLQNTNLKMFENITINENKDPLEIDDLNAQQKERDEVVETDNGDGQNEKITFENSSIDNLLGNDSTLNIKMDSEEAQKNIKSPNITDTINRTTQTDKPTIDTKVDTPEKVQEVTIDSEEKQSQKSEMHTEASKQTPERTQLLKVEEFLDKESDQTAQAISDTTLGISTEKETLTTKESLIDEFQVNQTVLPLENISSSKIETSTDFNFVPRTEGSLAVNFDIPLSDSFTVNALGFKRESTPENTFTPASYERESTQEGTFAPATDERESTSEDNSTPATDERESTPEDTSAPATNERESTPEDISAPPTDERESTPEDAFAPATEERESDPEKTSDPAKDASNDVRDSSETIISLENTFPFQIEIFSDNLTANQADNSLGYFNITDTKSPSESSLVTETTTTPEENVILHNQTVFENDLIPIETGSESLTPAFSESVKPQKEKELRRIDDEMNFLSNLFHFENHGQPSLTAHSTIIKAPKAADRVSFPEIDRPAKSDQEDRKKTKVIYVNNTRIEFEY